MPCEAIADIFIQFSQLVPSEVSKTITFSDFYIKNVPRSAWRDGAGNEYSYPVYQRSGLPDTFQPFEDITTIETSGDCYPPAVEVPDFASETLVVTLKQSATNTRDICLARLQNDFDIESQLANSVQQLRNATVFTWAQELQNRYIATVDNKVIYDTNGFTSDTTWLPVQAAYPLDWAILEKVYEELRYIAQPEDAAGIDEDGRMVFQLVGEFESFQNLKLQDSNFRDDLRFQNASDKGPNELVSAPGISSGKSYRGFKFETVQFAPRYDFVNGAYVQRYPYKQQATDSGNGTKLEVDPRYKNAAYTDIAVFIKNVFHHLVPKPKNLPYGYNYSLAQDWTGEFRWRMLPIDKECNPDGNKGFWRAVYSYGPQILRPDLGFVIRVQRCRPNYGQIGCTSPASA